MRFTREFQQDIEYYITNKPDTVIGKLRTFSLEDILIFIFGFYPSARERKHWRNLEDHKKLIQGNYSIIWPAVRQVNNKFILRNFWKKHEFRCDHPAIKPFSYAVGLKVVKEEGVQTFKHCIAYSDTNTFIQSKFFPYQRWFEEVYPIVKEAFEDKAKTNIPPELINKILDNLDWKKRVLKETRILKKNRWDLYPLGDIVWFHAPKFYKRLFKYCHQLLLPGFTEDQKDKADEIIWLANKSFLTEGNCNRSYYTDKIFWSLQRGTAKHLANTDEGIWRRYHREIYSRETDTQQSSSGFQLTRLTITL